MKGFVPSILVCVGLSFTAFASPQANQANSGPWRQIQGPLGDYTQSRLAGGFAVYVFAPSGSLLTVASFNRKSGKARFDKLEHAVRAHDFHTLPTKNIAHTARVLKIYLADQGYKLSDVAPKGARYSLLLVETDASDKTCGDVRRFQRHHETSIRHVTEQSPAAGTYAITVLRLKSSKPIVCADSYEAAKKILLKRRAHQASTHRPFPGSN